MNQLRFLAFFSVAALLPGGVPAQTDTLPPQLACVSSPVNFPIQFPCYSTVYGIDLISQLSDDQPMGLPLETGIRKACTGSGFPDAASATIYEWGLVPLEIWARDAAGNTSTCTVQLLAFDGHGACDPIWQIRVQTHDGVGIADVAIAIQGDHCTQPSFSDTVVTWSDSPTQGWAGTYMQYGFICPNEGYDLDVVPRRDADPLNGVTTGDLVRIQRHLLGLEPFTEPWQYLAADASQDGNVTTWDMVILRKLILGLTSELPGGRSWRFWPAGHVFPDPSNPLAPAPPHGYQLPGVQPIPGNFGFTGVKIGDLNGTADTGPL